MNLRQRNDVGLLRFAQQCSGWFHEPCLWWMMLGIALTGIVAMQVGSNPELVVDFLVINSFSG